MIGGIGRILRKTPYKGGGSPYGATCSNCSSGGHKLPDKNLEVARADYARIQARSDGVSPPFRFFGRNRYT